MRRTAQSDLILRSAVIAALALSACGRPDNRSLDEVTSSIRARSSAVQSLKDSKRVREDGRGKLRAEAGVYLEVAERRLLEEENYEREKVFTMLAKSYQLGRSNVEQIFGKLASRKK